jgi:hypothetical protein
VSRTSSSRRQARRWLTKRTAALMVAGLAVPAGIGAYAASAAVPSFPNNIVVFPDRDFIGIEGYQDHVGETALVEVSRAGQVIGSARSEVAAGDVAFEINHPGGVCWGAGTGLDVTPDIRPGDTVTVKFAGENAGDTTVQDTYVTHDSFLGGPDNATLTIKGHVGAGVDTDQMEQRIVNPDLTDTAIGRRDVRATPGPLTPSEKGGYSSSLIFDGDTFTATYVFDDPANAEIAANGGGERAMAWQEEDADANRQGLTISEYKESGGPGMGGCPAGPGDAGAPKPGTAAVTRSDDKTSLQVNWTPAEQVPTAEPVSGYSVEAIAATASSTSGDHVQIGRRTSASATRATITDLSASESYDVEVRSLAGPKMSEAFTVQVPAPDPLGDTIAPTLTATPDAGAEGAVAEAKSVTLSTEDGADIYYTTDGSTVISGGLPTDAAKLYAGPIPISQETVIKAVAFDRAGNTTPFTATYAPPAAADPVPGAPLDLKGIVGQRSVSLTWSATDPTITGYGVQVYDSAGPVGELRETTAKSMTVGELTAGTGYFFTVKAKNASGYGLESDKVGPLTPTAVTDRVTIGVARWKTGDFRVTGTGSVVGATVTVHPQLDGAIDTSRSLGSAAVVSVGAPTGGEYDVRLRNGAAPTTNPGRIYVKSTGGGVAGPFVVANG